MYDGVPTSSGWYPDPHTGGTRYWDGTRWTGDGRPRRRSFAAEARDNDLLRTIPSAGFLAAVALLGLGAGGESPVMVAIGVLVVVGCAVATVYVLRGQGPTTKAVQERLAAERSAADKAARRAARSRRGPLIGVNIEAPDVAGAAQVNAIANPETAQALQNLQNLRYTRAISDEEFAAAKDRLLGTRAAPPDSLAHVEKLVELHRAGVLSDVEFAAAKAKALGI
jgi:hypothetical protein